jgi:hypothetical protein
LVFAGILASSLSGWLCGSCEKANVFSDELKIQKLNGIPQPQPGRASKAGSVSKTMKKLWINRLSTCTTQNDSRYPQLEQNNFRRCPHVHHHPHTANLGPASHISTVLQHPNKQQPSFNTIQCIIN